jgi:hypothetical protein
MKSNKNYRKSILFAIILFLMNCTSVYSNQKTINVKISNNIETLAVLYIISDVGLNAHQGSLSYEAKQQFKNFKNHEIIALFKELLKKTDLGKPIKFFLSLSEFPDARISATLDTGFIRTLIGSQNINDTANFINKFLKSANDFYVKAKIAKFIQDHKSYYDKCISDVIKNLPDDNFIPTMENYYGKKFNSYTIVPSPILFPFIGFGFTIKNQTKSDVFYVAGPYDEPDSTQKYAYGFNSSADIREMCVHEFGHSFVNPTTDLPKNKELIEKYSHLFDPIKKYMTEQAYGDWYTCVNEHIVRLGEIRIANAMNDTVTANRLRDEYLQNKKFVYLPYLERNILEYEKSREKYKSFDEFFLILIQKSFTQIDTTELKI